jgi:putative glycosyltransferase (TIGR04348 family)
MKICIVTPAPSGSRKGNRVTAERWARFLIDLGHEIAIVVDYEGQPCDLLIALHAFKSHAALRRFHDEYPGKPCILGLTGTDLYGDIHTRPEAAASLELATRLVLLQPHGCAELPEHLRAKARVIYQSVQVPPQTMPPWNGLFGICVMGHLRPVKDPFRTALAAQLLPTSSRIQVLHLGAALSEDMALQARAMVVSNPRYHWLGDLPWIEAMGVLSRCRLLALTSQLEGGANVISEAVTLGVPVVSSAISGSIGLLGSDYPGFYPYGDTQALANLLGRAEMDAVFYQSLAERCALCRPLFEPSRERQSWDDLLKELFASTDRSG